MVNTEFSYGTHWPNLVTIFLISVLGGIVNSFSVKEELTFKKTLKIASSAAFAGSLTYFFLFGFNYFSETTKWAMSAIASFGSTLVLPRFLNILLRFLDKFDLMTSNDYVRIPAGYRGSNHVYQKSPENYIPPYKGLFNSETKNNDDPPSESDDTTLNLDSESGTDDENSYCAYLGDNTDDDTEVTVVPPPIAKRIRRSPKTVVVSDDVLTPPKKTTRKRTSSEKASTDKKPVKAKKTSTRKTNTVTTKKTIESNSDD